MTEKTGVARKVALEKMLPHEISEALSLQSIVYLPLGAIEYHGPHLPIGLDGLTAHGLCLHTAKTEGGVVFPANYYGMTGSIGHHPWTICVEDEYEIITILRLTLRRLEDFGVRLAVVFTGHFGRRQLAVLDEIQESWTREGHQMRLLCLSINRCPQAKMTGDHAAIFETSLLKQMHPDLVELEQLPPIETHPANDPMGDSWGAHRRNPENLLFGILGDDPRHYDSASAIELLKTIQEWFQSMVREHYPNS